jgi:Xaa-Pro aminopeptidase
MQKNIVELRELIAKENLDGFFLSTTDAYQNEYVPPAFQRLSWLSGFTGSAGAAIISKEKAAFFTDGRYTEQAKRELSSDFTIHNTAIFTPSHWLREQKKNFLLGLDPWLVTEPQSKNFIKAGAEIIALQQNPIDILWHEKPEIPQSAVKNHALRFSGQNSLSKRKEISNKLKSSNADALLITSLDSIAWLLNIRAADIPFTPFVLGYAFLIAATQHVHFFVHHNNFSKLEKTSFHENNYASITAELAVFKGKNVAIDPNRTPLALVELLEKNGVILQRSEDPCQILKACKNKTEQMGAKAAHVRDGTALTEFLCWFSQHGCIKNFSEYQLGKILETYRKEQDLFVSQSFETISGFKENAAIIHYRATEQNAKTITGQGLYLLDSGGQYHDGTTDVTRTIAVKKASSLEKRHYTLVLKGHIALASAVFVQGTKGSELDHLARQFLWQDGLDYDHGTGHGVGSFLSVHEGPQRIAKRGGDIALQCGMIISNEPGFYKSGEYGIRIENLVLVKNAGKNSQGKELLSFETLTLAPLDPNLIAWHLLNEKEKFWLLQYHQKILTQLAPKLKPSTKKWLKEIICQFEGEV